MHIEKNVFDNVFNTVLSFDDKTKDNPQSRQDTVKFVINLNWQRIVMENISNLYIP